MKTRHRAEAVSKSAADSRGETTLAERLKTRFQNTKIIAYAIVIGSIIFGLSKFLEVSSKLLEEFIPPNVAAYDSRTEECAFQVAKDLDDFFSRLAESPEGQRTFNQFRDDYRKIEVELRELELRNRIRPLNELSTEQIKTLLTMWSRFKSTSRPKARLISSLLSTSTTT